MSAISLVLGLTLFLLQSAYAAIHWTPQEAAWIAAHPQIRLGVDPDRRPMEFVDGQGRHQGMSLEIVRYLEKSTGIHFVTTTNLKWQDVLQGVEKRTLDVVASVRPTSSRLQYMAFTKPYMHVPIVIVTHADAAYIDGLDDLAGMRIGILPNNATAQHLIGDSLAVDYVPYTTYQAALSGLAQKENDAVVVDLSIATFELRTRDLPLRIAAPTPYNSEFSLGIRNDWPELVAIFDKALEGLTEQDKAAIKNEWINAQLVMGTPWSKVLRVGSVILMVFLLVLGMFIWWNRRLKREVEERKRAQAEALESANKFQVLFNFMDQAFSVQELIRDEQGKVVDYRYLEVNPAFGRLLNVNPQTFTGKTRKDMPVPMDDEWLLLVQKVAESGEPVEIDKYLERMGRWLHYYLFSPRKDVFACTIADITEQKTRLENMQSHMDEMTHFIYSVSHDLNGPNLTISSFVHLLMEDLKDYDNPDVHENLNFIATASARMSTLLNGLLMVAKVGPKTLERHPCDMRSLAEEAGKLVGGTFAEKNITYRITAESMVIMADQDRLIQVLQNLLENAAKYMGEQASPQVEFGMQYRNGEKVFFVRDNGMGIPVESLNRIFDIFEKVDRGGEGTGIGLALVKRIVAAHGGRIWAESAGLGQGTAFCFTLST